MELLIVILIAITPVLIGLVISYFVVLIQGWNYRRQTRKEIEQIKSSLGKVECVKHTLPTGEVEILGPGEVYIFDRQKAGTFTSAVGYEELEEMGATLDEAEKLIKEAKEKKI